jgi:hypothetical protein
MKRKIREREGEGEGDSSRTTGGLLCLARAEKERKVKSA